MKTFKLNFLIVAILASFCIASCSTSSNDPAVTPSPTPTPNPVGNAGDLKLFVVDTAKVNTVTMLGTNETTVLNRKVNTSSYIGSLSLNNNASKFVYADTQGLFTNVFVATNTIRTANADGTGDMAIYTAPTNTNSVSTQLGMVKYGASKIYYTTLTTTNTGPTISRLAKLNVTNFDGSGLVQENYQGLNVFSTNADDISSNGKYLSTFSQSPNIPKFIVVDRTGDNGAGTFAYQETINSSQIKTSNSVISFDDKFAYYAFVENQSIKVRIVNLTTFTATTSTIGSGITATSLFITLSVASDNNRGVVVVDNYSNALTKTYVFNLSGGSSTTFNNIDSSITSIKAY